MGFVVILKKNPTVPVGSYKTEMFTIKIKIKQRKQDKVVFVKKSEAGGALPSQQSDMLSGSKYW